MRISKRLQDKINDKFLSMRRESVHAAGETTLLCYGAMDLCSGNNFERKLGVRIINSLFKRNDISATQTHEFITSIYTSKKSEVASYLLRLNPYKEMKQRLLLEV